MGAAECESEKTIFFLSMTMICEWLEDTACMSLSSDDVMQFIGLHLEIVLL